jgi:hypothetical protein
MKARESQELKVLQTRRGAQEVLVDEARRAVKEAQSRLTTESNKLDEIDRAIFNLADQAKEPVVTEHALLRYVERVMGVDLDEIRAQILNESAVGLINQLRTAKIPMRQGSGFRLVVRDRTVVSIEPA